MYCHESTMEKKVSLISSAGSQLTDRSARRKRSTSNGLQQACTQVVLTLWGLLSYFKSTTAYTFSLSPQPVSAMHSFVLAMVLYPDVQRKAQAEVDAIVGSGRLPTFSDRTHLPYTVCLMKEVIRWGVRCVKSFQNMACLI